MNHMSFGQRNELRAYNSRPRPNRGDYILGAVGIGGCVVVLILNLLGVA